MNATIDINSTTTGVNSTEGPQVDDGFNVPVIALVIGISNLIAGSLLMTALLKLKSGKLKKTTRYFLLFQTASHLLAGIFGLSRGFLKEFSCECTILMPCIASLICCSTLLISVDSFICIYKPFTHKLLLTEERAKMAILFMIVLPLVLIPVAVLTGKNPSENSVCFTIHDSYFTPVQIIIFYSTVMVLIVLSIVFQGWAIILIYRMNRVGQGPSTMQNTPTVSGTPMVPRLTHTESTSVEKGSKAQKHMNAPPRTEAVAGPSGRCPRTLQVTTHGALQSPDNSTITKGVVTIHVLTPSERDVQSIDRQQHLRQVMRQVSTLQQNPTGNTTTRQKRLVRLLTAALVLTVVAWSPTVVAALVVSAYDLVGIEKPAWFATARWQLALLLYLGSVLYPIITLSLSSELRACLKSLFCTLCSRTSGE